MKPRPLTINLPVSSSKLLLMAQIVVLAGLVSGCGKAQEEIDFGIFNHSIYTNRYFGMTVAIPADWSIQDQEAQRRLMKLGGNIVAGDDKNMKSLLKASELQSVNLFAAFQYPVGTPVTFNPSVLAMAEKVRELPGIKTGKDYLFSVRRIMELAQIQVLFPKDVYTEHLAGTNFDVMETTISVHGITVRQKYYATIEKGYALSFVISFEDDQQLSDDQKILNTVRFH